ncbi:MAG: chromate efflux transporter [Planctomycetes bacterium]|nr:chromate efflux transporter [Planctomycetota bacterium]
MIPEHPVRLREVAALFLRLGFISFGGPAAHLAMIEEEVVERRKWLTRQHFLDLVGAVNLIPGPNSTEMAIYVGYVRAGFRGLVVAGLAFILPATLITAAFAWAYVEFGSLPEVNPFLYGIKPAVLGVILAAAWRLGRTAVKGWRLLAVGTAVAAAALLGAGEVLALFAGGVLGMLWLRLAVRGRTPHSGGAAAAAIPGLAAAGLASVQASAVPLATSAAGPSALAVPLASLGLFFLKVGSVLYGSGYVLVAFLEGGLVHDYRWLDQQQLLDAIAIGQFTPGPVLSTATFIGYLLAGAGGAAVATAAIFLPSFFFVAVLHPAIPLFRRSPWSAAFLDAVNVSAIGLMVAVTIQLARSSVSDSGWPAVLIVLAASAIGFRWKVNAAWLVLGGCLAGWLLQILPSALPPWG